MGKKIRAFLFWAGIFITIISFFVDKVDKFPFMVPIIAPAYIKAAKGIKILETKKQLVPSDEGFTELEQVYREELKEPVEGKEIKRFFNRDVKVIGYTDDEHPISVEFSENKTLPWGLDTAKRKIEVLKDRRQTIFVSVLFFIGICLLLLSRACK